MFYNKLDLEHIAWGACFLGGGGGGPLDAARDIIRQLPDNWKVEVISVEEAAKQKELLTCVSLFGGSPTSADGLTIEPAIVAMEKMQEEQEKRIGFTIGLEVGAVNTIVPCLVAREKNMKVIDADGSGRAVPELTQTTFSTARGLSMNPTIMGSDDTDQAGDSGLARTVVLNFGAYARMKEVFVGIIQTGPFNRVSGIAIWPIDSANLEKAVPIRGTLEMCREVGKPLRASDLATALKILGKYKRRYKRIVTGTLTDIHMGGKAMYDIGRLVINGDKKKNFNIYFQNESIAAWSSSSTKPLAVLPDSICAIRTWDSHPFSNGVDPKDFIGQEVTIIVVKACQALLQSKEIMDAYRETNIQFGYAGPYIDQFPPRKK
jgi:uncharacterized protein